MLFRSHAPLPAAAPLTASVREGHGPEMPKGQWTRCAHSDLLNETKLSERVKGFEPSTSTLARLHSTTELHPRDEAVCIPLTPSGSRENHPRVSFPTAARTATSMRRAPFCSRYRVIPRITVSRIAVSTPT